MRSQQAVSGEPNRESRVNFNEQVNRRRTYGSMRGRGSSSSYATGDNRPRGATSEEAQLATDRPQMRDQCRAGRCDSANWSHLDEGRSLPSDSNRRENSELLSKGNDAQARHSRDAIATAFELLNSSLDTFLTRLSMTIERSEKTRCLRN